MAARPTFRCQFNRYRRILKTIAVRYPRDSRLRINHLFERNNQMSDSNWIGNLQSFLDALSSERAALNCNKPPLGHFEAAGMEKALDEFELMLFDPVRLNDFVNRFKTRDHFLNALRKRARWRTLTLRAAQSHKTHKANVLEMPNDPLLGSEAEELLDRLLPRCVGKLTDPLLMALRYAIEAEDRHSLLSEVCPETQYQSIRRALARARHSVYKCLTSEGFSIEDLALVSPSKIATAVRQALFAGGTR